MYSGGGQGIVLRRAVACAQIDSGVMLQLRRRRDQQGAIQVISRVDTKYFYLSLLIPKLRGGRGVAVTCAS